MKNNIPVSKTNILICLMITVVGLIFSTIGYCGWADTNNIIKHGVKTEGRVVDLLTNYNKKKRSSTKAPVVQFKTQQGETILYTSSMYSSPCPYHQGQSLPIWYLPDNPQEATLNGTETYLFFSIFAGFGALALLFGLPTLFKVFTLLLFR
jgi:hypothetical protein